MSRYDTRRQPGRGLGRKFIGLVTVAALAYWAGHDPAGALAVVHGLGQFVSDVTHHAKARP